MSAEASTHPKSNGSRSAAPLVWTALLVVGVAGWIYCLWIGDADRAWRAMLINFLFFTPLSAALVVWPAVVMVSRGEWATGLERRALAGLAFAPVSLVALAALYFGRSHWAAWMSATDLPNAGWLNVDFLFARDAAALVVFWALAAWFVARRPRRPTTLAGWLVLTYALVFSLIAFDLAMSLDPRSYSALFGGYFFMSAAYAAVVAWTFLALAGPGRPASREQRGDLGKLVLACSLLTSYMMFSQLIVMWYENLPAEARFIVPRLRFEQYGFVGAALLGTIYLGPLALLVGARAKRNPLWLGAVSALLLVMLWLERWWIVTPALGGAIAFGVAEVSMTLAFLSALALGMIVFGRFSAEGGAS